MKLIQNNLLILVFELSIFSISPQEYKLQYVPINDIGIISFIKNIKTQSCSSFTHKL